MKTRILSTIFSLVISLGVGILCAVKLYEDYKLYTLIFCGAMILALPLSDLIHESGHIIFGLIVNIRTKPHFSLFSSSHCELIPHTSKNLRAKLILVSSGGLILNACTLILCILSLFIKELPPYLCVLAPTSAYLYIFNQIPAYLQNGKTDGQVILDLLLLTDEGKVMLSVFKVQSLLIGGISIQNIDKNLLFNQPIVREDDRAFIILTQLRLEYSKATGDKNGEKEYAERLKELQEYV